jgi:hypothetical protein
VQSCHGSFRCQDPTVATHWTGSYDLKSPAYISYTLVIVVNPLSKSLLDELAIKEQKSTKTVNMFLAQIAANTKSSNFLLQSCRISKIKSHFVQTRMMAKESSKQTIIPPPPPDKASDIARIGIMSFGAILAVYIAVMPENNYDSIGLMGTPGKLPPPKLNN